MTPALKYLAVTSALMLSATGARAQATYNQPGGSDLGGGFIEMLMTGRDPGPSRRDYRAYPADPQRASLARETIATRDPGPEFRRQTVAYGGPESRGTIVIDTPSKFLYLVEGNGTAVRYGIGVGRPGFMWSGTKIITAKREWPDWTPPAEMLKRRPDLPRHMEGGPENPLGARAMYLGSTLYRIHGTNEPYTIGQNVSSGCIRMMNEDVEDLYERVPVGTHVKVI